MRESSGHQDNRNHQNIEEKPFIQEKIVKKPLSFREWLARAAVFAGAGVLFGAVSCLTFVCLRPILENHLYSAEDDTQTWESVSKSETEETTTGVSDESQEVSYDKAQIKKIIEELAKQKNLNIQDYQNLYYEIASIAEQAEHALVSVIAVTQDVDWFDTQYEREGTVAGIVVKQASEVLILTDSTIIQEADSLKVRFCDGKEVNATVKDFNATLGFAMLSVQKNDIKDSTWKKIAVADIGSSQSVKKGSPILVIGSPENISDSLGIGYISTVYDTDDYGVDWSMPIFTTDISVKGSGCSFLLDMEGKLIGIYPYTEKDQDAKERRKALAIDGINQEITALEDGKELALLGVKVQEVTEEISKKYEVPDGLYVTSVVADSPAYDAGIQNGDVITKLSSDAVTTVEELKEFLLKTEPQKEVTAVVKRSSAHGYDRIELKVILEKR